MPVRGRIKIFRATIGTLEQEVNNFLANSEEIDDLVDVKIMETGNNTAVALVVYRKREEGGFSPISYEHFEFLLPLATLSRNVLTLGKSISLAIRNTSCVGF